MGAHRHHRDVLAAGWVLVGAYAWLGTLVTQGVAPSDTVEPLLWFVAAFAAAQIARRVLVDLDVSEVGVAAAVTIALVIGIRYERDHRSLDVGMLAPIVVSEAGALAGAWAVRARKPAGHALLTIAAGAGGFGVAVVCIGLALFVRSFDLELLAVVFGLPVGGLVTAWLVDRMRWFHAAVGQSVALGVLLLVVSDSTPITGLLRGLVLGVVAGGIGGWLGNLLRSRSRPTESTLPTVRQVN